MVLRHELAVLRRQAGRAELRVADRVFLAAASRLLPRSSWRSFVVTPTTLLLGTVGWSQSAGRTPVESAAHRLRARSASSCCASRVRTHGGAISGSLASCAGSPSRYRPRPCASCFARLASDLPESAQATASSLVTSTRSSKAKGSRRSGRRFERRKRTPSPSASSAPSARSVSTGSSSSTSDTSSACFASSSTTTTATGRTARSTSRRQIRISQRSALSRRRDQSMSSVEIGSAD